VAGNSQTYGDTFGQLREREYPTHYIGAEFSIKLSRRAERSQYRARQAVIEQLLWELKRLEQSIMVEIDNAVKLARTNYERVNASREARQFAEAALDAEQKKLASGKSTTFVVLRLQRDLTDRRAAEIRAQLDYFRALTDLSLAEGTILEKNDIDVEIE
jgi:outer membrane protein TolC